MRYKPLLLIAIGAAAAAALNVAPAAAASTIFEPPGGDVCPAPPPTTTTQPPTTRTDPPPPSTTEPPTTTTEPPTRTTEPPTTTTSVDLAATPPSGPADSVVVSDSTAAPRGLRTDRLLVSAAEAFTDSYGFTFEAKLDNGRMTVTIIANPCFGKAPPSILNTDRDDPNLYIVQVPGLNGRNCQILVHITGGPANIVGKPVRINDTDTFAFTFDFNRGMARTFTGVVDIKCTAAKR